MEIKINLRIVSHEIFQENFNKMEQMTSLIYITKQLVDFINNETSYDWKYETEEGDRDYCPIATVLKFDFEVL